jgi:protein gp37
MSRASKIEWLARPGTKTATWNPIRGCTRVSEGCRNCYAERMAARFSDPGYWGHGYAERVPTADGKSWVPRWTGRVGVIEDMIDAPRAWRGAYTIFVNSTSDLFQDAVPFDVTDRIAATINDCPRHEFIALTKRPERMRDWAIHRMRADQGVPRNLWLGVSVEDQWTADARIPLLLDTPGASVRWVSAEPLLGWLDLRSYLVGEEEPNSVGEAAGWRPPIDWVVTGGESGPKARPMHPDWALDLRDQCNRADVPFFFKQWGEWAPGECAPNAPTRTERGATWFDGRYRDGPPDLYRVGKHAAGAVLDGREHKAWPR